MLASNTINRAGGKKERLYLWPAEEKNTEVLKKIKDKDVCMISVYGALGAFPACIIKGDSSHRNCSRDRKHCQILVV